MGSFKTYDSLQNAMKVELVVDGKRIPLNTFVQKVFCNVVSALISALKGVDEDWKEVEIKLTR
jgi:hypothetical protein